MTDNINNTSKPALYSFRRCPYAMRARMAILYSQQPIEIREIILRDKPNSLLEYSPKGTVPVLVLENREVIEESLDIMIWALTKNDPESWLPESKTIRSNMFALIKQCDDEFKVHLDHYKYADRYPEHSMNVYRQRGELFLKKLNTMVSTQKYIHGPKVGLADIAIFPFVRQFAHVDKVWFDQSEYEHLKKWLALHLGSAVFLNIMQKYPQRKAGDHPTFLH